MADAHANHHDYHLVDPSPWPAVGAVSAFMMAVGAHHLDAPHVRGGAAGVRRSASIGVLYTLIGWWRDVIREAQYEGFHTRVVQISHRYGMILFIASEVMFFVAWFWAYFNTALFPDDAHDVAPLWPSPTACGRRTGIETFDPWHLPLLNTLILLTSGTTVTWAHHALLENDRQGLKWGLVLTILLGITFTCVQAYEYSHAAFHYSRQHLRRHLLHGDRLPRRPCHHRLDLPDRLPDARHGRPFHPDPASRLRIRRLVLAFRRRGLAVPVRLHICVGRRRRASRNDRSRCSSKRAAATPPFCFKKAKIMSDPASPTPLADRPRPARPLPALRRGQAVPGLPRRCGRVASIAASTTASPMPATGRRCS